MKAILTGDDQLLTFGDYPFPQLKQGEVLIKVHAAGINRADIFQAEGLYPPPEGVSPLLGLEVAGEIAEIAPDVIRFQKGSKVCALLAGGGYAEYVAVPIEQLLPIPQDYTMIMAASLPETFFTVWSALYEKAMLKEGESLLVHAGASGIGTTAIQLATALGSQVYTTAGSNKKCDFCENLGASKAFNYKEHDIIEAMKPYGKVDVVLDILGGEYLAKNMSLLSPSGRLVSLAFLEGKNATINMASLLLKNLTLMGMTLRSQSLETKNEIRDKLLTHVWPLLQNQTIVPIIDKVFPISKAQEAHDYMKTNQHIGKIVLTFD